MAIPPLPTVMTIAGLTPQSPAVQRANLVAEVSLTNPGFTDNLPGALIEDVTSTCIGALQILEQGRVEFINSITPYGANAFLLNELGQIYGVAPAKPSNTSVLVVFSGSVGFIIPPGFLISDGSHQYAIAGLGGIIGSGGSSLPLLAVASVSGSWAIPVGTVINRVTSVPSGIILTVTNPNAGAPGDLSETTDTFRARVLQAGLASSVGMARFLKTVLNQIPGVNSRLIALRQVVGGWQVIVGGSGDPYQIAYAVLAGFDISRLQGSTIDPTRDVVTNLNDYPDVYTITTIFPPGQTVSIVYTWNTTGTGVNFVSGAAVSAAGQSAIIAYINSIPVGAPLNLFEVNEVFRDSVEGIVDPVLLTRSVASVSINGSPVSPISGTGVIQGDPESFWTTDPAHVIVTQG